MDKMLDAIIIIGIYLFSTTLFQSFVIGEAKENEFCVSQGFDRYQYLESDKAAACIRETEDTIEFAKIETEYNPLNLFIFQDITTKVRFVKPRKEIEVKG